MSDWCCTEVIFEGKNTKKLYKDWENALKKNPEDRDYPWLGFLFETWKDKEEIDVYINKIFVDDYEFDKEKNILTFRINEPYEPHFDVYDLISQKYKLKYYLLATEPANRVFINTDKEKKYFSETYYFELWFSDEEIETKLFEKLKKLNEIRYIEDFETIKELLEEYGVEAEDDMFKLCEYIDENYPDVIVVFDVYTEHYKIIV
ncbi:hypothetical protein SAMN04244560_01044 [Thermoanaerobacter thermohydrosulfuricus]|uniref:Uncharacterized protein n=1 Tax=Thermoanaerobacter thermohydrosulfuricus TaxID=1516 RepID=A0A1G7MWT6_THETY|nr:MULTISPECIES: hypothetical protein [Thermoanaerobacter]UZQ81768.1 hypothetical protein OEI98_001505 [Thermoanaerobacter sp. RKWS2]SDF66305.1 hypothetical protein SAMN04244560_01044 [Thermoanaerobacter thermohydrosulfuricus]